MTRWSLVIACSAVWITSIPGSGLAAGRGDQKLSADKQIIHILNRLTFGPRPGDVEQVRRVGIDKWIDLQLHPDRIPENPVLDARLRPLDTLQLPVWEILEKYPAAPAMMARPPSAIAFSSLLPQQISRLINGSLEERQNTLAALEPGLRRLVLAGAPPPVMEGLPADLQQEAASARKAEQEERQKEMRRLMPPLNELLSPAQIRTATQGSPEEKLALVDTFDGPRRPQIMRALPLQSLAAVPALRREAMAANQPQQLVNSELIEQKLYRALYSNRQLEEVLVDFWMNHFNVFNGKGPDRVLLTSFERDAIRPRVFGHFKDLLLATARHPAMLFYLDNWQSQAPREDSPLPTT